MVLTLTPTSVKLFRFTWTDVNGESEYRLLENPNGTSGFTQVATIAADGENYDWRVFLPARVNARYILQACNSAGCTDSNTVTVTGTLAGAVGYIKASNTGPDDAFGAAIALSADGSTLAVGASHEDSAAAGINGDQSDNSAHSSGAVYVYTRIDNAWSQQAYIKASNANFVHNFGVAVALSADGNTLAVGAPGERSGATGINGDQTDNSYHGSGAVYVYTRSGSTWSQQAYIKASTADNPGFVGKNFGSSVALAADGNTLAVGARLEGSRASGINGDESDNLAHAAGAVYVFTRVGSTWSQQAYIKASNPAGRHYFGTALGLSADGNTLAVSAPGERGSGTGINGPQHEDNTTSIGILDAGAVYVYTRVGSTWSQQAYIKASNTDEHDHFGFKALALSADGNTLAVGAFAEDSSATGINGDQSNELLYGFDSRMFNSGAVYVYVRVGGTWSQQAYVKASNTEAGDVFGSSVSLSADGNIMAVGAIGEDSAATGVNGNQSDNAKGSSGAVYVYTRAGTTWSPLAYVKASNPDIADEFGTAVALSGDGKTLAVGAPGERSNATGINGDQSDNSMVGGQIGVEAGAVYLF